jgi:hypothetical protein
VRKTIKVVNGVPEGLIEMDEKVKFLPTLINNSRTILPK